MPKLSLTPNPLMARLIQNRAEINLRHEIIFTVGIMVCSVLFVIAFLGSPVLLCLAPPSALFTLISVVLLPGIVAAYAWRITSHHLQDHTDELLFLTNLSSSSILWAYVAAPLYRWRSLLRWAIGLAPTMTLFLMIGLILYQNDLDDRYWCVDSPLGTHYCTSEDEGAIIEQSSAAILIVPGLCISIGFAGTYLLAALAGTGIAYSLRDRLHASIAALTVFFGLTIVWAILFVELACSVLLSPPPANTLKIVFYSILFAIAPIALALLGARLCLRRVRRPS